MWTLVRNVTSVCFLLLLTPLFTKETLAMEEPSLNNDIQDIVWQLLRFNYTIIRQALLDTLASSPGASGSVLNSRGSGEKMSAMSARKSALGDKMCVHHTAAFLAALEDGQVWALQMFDAMGKSRPGLSSGHMIWSGDYGLCHEVVSNISTLSLPRFYGKYCIARILARKMPYISSYKLSNRETMEIGLCVPNTCSEDDVDALFNNMTARLNLLSWEHVTISFSIECQDQQLDTKVIAAIAVCSVLLLCVVLGTTVDVVIILRSTRHDDGHGDNEQTALLAQKKSAEQMRNEAGVGVKALLAFSMYTNIARLMSTRQAEGNLTCLHGIRLISITWVVLGHSYSTPNGRTTINILQEYDRLLKERTSLLLFNAGVSVDSFFVMSGLLVAYLTLKELVKNDGKLNWFLFYFHRFWRLTPTYMFVMMVYVCLTPYLIEGPLRSRTIPDRDQCTSQWWQHLLYINGVIPDHGKCMIHTWYLANDMQFYCVLSPLVILLLHKVPLCGILVAISLILANSVINAALTMVYYISPIPQVPVKDKPLYSPYKSYLIYYEPYARMAPYVLGLLVGYFMHVRDRKLSVRWYINILIWAVATGSAVGVEFGLPEGGESMTVEAAAVYNATRRIVWAACVSWVILACVTGNGGIILVETKRTVSVYGYDGTLQKVTLRVPPVLEHQKLPSSVLGFVNTFLSWSAFVPLSRLSYCMYLLHPVFITLFLYNRSSPLYKTWNTVVNMYLAILVVTTLAATVLSLFVECPLVTLEKVILQREQRRDEKSPAPLQDVGQDTKHSADRCTTY